MRVMRDVRRQDFPARLTRPARHTARLARPAGLARPYSPARKPVGCLTPQGLWCRPMLEIKAKEALPVIQPNAHDSLWEHPVRSV